MYDVLRQGLTFKYMNCGSCMNAFSMKIVFQCSAKGCSDVDALTDQTLTLVVEHQEIRVGESPFCGDMVVLKIDYDAAKRIHRK